MCTQWIFTCEIPEKMALSTCSNWKFSFWQTLSDHAAQQ